MWEMHDLAKGGKKKKSPGVVPLPPDLLQSTPGENGTGQIFYTPNPVDSNWFQYILTMIRIEDD